MKKCTNCGAQIADDSLFCTECGKPIPQGNVCPHCGASLNEGDAFCTNCGMKVDERQSTSPSESSSTCQNENVEFSDSNRQIGEDVEQKPSSKKTIPVIIAIIVLILIVGGWYGYKVYTANNDNIPIDSTSIDSEAATKQQETTEPFTTIMVSYKESAPGESFDVETEIKVDYPNTGSVELKNGIISFILDVLNNTYTWEEVSKNPHYEGDLTNGKTIVDFYGKAKIKELQEVGIGEEKIYITKNSETEKYVSYLVDFSGNHGGAGGGTKYGVTFRKADGKRVRIISNPNDRQLKTKLIFYVNEKGGTSSPEELEAHPFPKKEPFLTDDGVHFIYQKYEIGSGADGIIDVSIPYYEIANFLSDDALYLTDSKSNNTDGSTSEQYSNYVGTWKLNRTTDSGKMRMEVTLREDHSGEFVVFVLHGSHDEVIVYEKYPQCVLTDGIIYLTKNGNTTQGDVPKLKAASDGLYSFDNEKYVRVSQ